MRIVFITKPDETGKGRIIIDGRYYALPLEAVIEYEKLRKYLDAPTAAFMLKFDDGYSTVTKSSFAVDGCERIQLIERMED